jgi:hypothetical protein
MNKKTRIALGIVLGAVILLHITWGAYHMELFGKYKRITKDENVPGIHIASRNGDTFSISKMKYLQFSGNLGISTGNDQHLLIWPKFFGHHVYGLMVVSDNVIYNFYIDEEGSLLNGNQFGAAGQEVFEKNKEVASELIETFHAWTVAAEKRDQDFFDAN